MANFKQQPGYCDGRPQKVSLWLRDNKPNTTAEKYLQILQPATNNWALCKAANGKGPWKQEDDSKNKLLLATVYNIYKHKLH
jgi:hypothetical protein